MLFRNARKCFSGHLMRLLFSFLFTSSITSSFPTLFRADFIGPPLNFQCLPIDNNIAYFSTCLQIKAVKCGLRDVHMLGALFLFQSVNIFQSYRLEFINRQNDFFQLSHWYSCWFKVGDTWFKAHPSATSWSRHPFFTNHILSIVFQATLSLVQLFSAYPLAFSS